MPRKQEESADTRTESATRKSAAAAKPRKAAVKSAAVKKESAGEGAAVKKSAAAKSASARTSAAKPAAKKSAAPKNKGEKPSADAESGKTSPARKKAAAPRKVSAKKKEESPAAIAAAASFASVEDPIGDTTDGEAHSSLAPQAETETGTAMMDADRADASEEASPDGAEAAEGETEERRASGKRAAAKGQPSEPHLERLQKILSQAGVASRRHAEEMIVAGRVMVNGQVVTQLGAKADPARDHIRADGKLIQGAERHRTFLLNKPKGYVTTVSDPEGRPTVVKFFEKMRERLYPVGRLDYQSEGLLLMTNDGELANGLTRAASGVEKTYLVKVAGQPTEEELDQLRSGVSIDREQAGSGRVRTAPASVLPVRAGNNPWYEVVLTEGRNRELRKMFQAVGHFVEKIRRVGYGPLVLDVEPGQFRELTAEEVNALRLTAEGKLKPRRPKTLAMIPKEAARAAEGGQAPRFGKRNDRANDRVNDRVNDRSNDRSNDRRGEARGEFRRGAPPQRSFRPAGRQPLNSSNPGRPSPGRPGFDKPGFDRPRSDRPSSDRPSSGRPGPGRPSFDRPRFDRTSGARPANDRPRYDGRPRNDRPGYDRPERTGEAGGKRFDQPRLEIREETGSGYGEQPRGASPRREFGGARPAFGKPRFDRPRSDRPRSSSGPRPGGPRPSGPRPDRPRYDRPERGSRPESSHQGTQPRRDFPRASRPDRAGAPANPSRPAQSGSPRFDRERTSRPGGGEWKPRGGSDRQQRPPRRDNAPRGGAQSFSGPGRSGGGNPRRGPGFGAKPGGFRGSGPAGNRGGGPSRGGRGPQRG